MNPRDARIVIVGAGPAGLTAAASLVHESERDILVIDRDDAAGGLPRFCSHPGFGWKATRRLETGPGFVRRMLASLDGAAVTIATRTSALAIGPGPTLDIVSPDFGHRRLEPRAVILATGIRERPRSARLVPGHRPERGVLTTGQLQQIVARGGRFDGRRAVVVGTEHVAFSPLATARHAGLRIVAMIGEDDRVMSFAAAGWIARALGVAIHLETRVAAIEGTQHVEAVVIEGPAGTQRIACDTVIFSGDFVPDTGWLQHSELAIDPRTHGPMIDRYGRTNIKGVFAAGNMLRAVESSGRVANEARQVGFAVSRFLAENFATASAPMPIRIGGELAYVVPQLWTFSETAEYGAIAPTARVARDVRRAHLRLLDGTRELWQGRAREFRRLRRIGLSHAIIDGLTTVRDPELRVDPI